VRVRIVVLVAVLLLAVARIVTWHQLELGPLHRIVVSNVEWDGSGFWQIAVDESDRYVYEHGAEETKGRIAFAPLAQRLAAVTEIRYLPAGGSGDGLTFWIEGRRRIVAPFIAWHGADHAALRSFATALHDAVAADARRQDAPRIEALTSLRDLAAVEVVSNGCFGRCGVYDVVLRRGGGTMSWQGYPGTTRHRAPPVAWQLVVRALHESHVERLDRRYPSRAIDTASATLRFVLPRVTYSVEAPDSSTWPPEFVAAFGAIRHLAHDMAWSPKLDAEQLRTLGR
jgi:hypothetical protein